MGEKFYLCPQQSLSAKAGCKPALIASASHNAHEFGTQSSELVVTKTYSAYMRFYDRTEEIDKLQRINSLSGETARLTVITGRRRIGKTSLVLKAYGSTAMLYFFVSRKTEAELCRDFAEEIAAKLQIPIFGIPTRFADIFSYLMQLAKTRHIILMIDEFQDFRRVNSSIFSDMQKIWDIHKHDAKINLIVCGSIYHLMTELFVNSKEPLYGRQTDFIKLEPFAPKVLKEILADHHPGYSHDDLLALFIVTGGVAKYVELLMDSHIFTKDEMLRAVVAKNSLFIYEGRSLLIEEFGKDYGRYFDILTLISTGHNSRSDMEALMECELSGYLNRLENDYGLITKSRPMFSTSQGKNVRYAINDQFVRLWFRFIYKYNSMIEANAHSQLQAIVERDYPTYSGRCLEDFFRCAMKNEGRFTHIDAWWDRKGENEIDIIAIDDLSHAITFFEVKRQEQAIDLSILRAKAEKFLTAIGRYARYRKEYKGLSMADM